MIDASQLQARIAPALARRLGDLLLLVIEKSATGDDEAEPASLDRIDEVNRDAPDHIDVAAITAGSHSPLAAAPSQPSLATAPDSRTPPQAGPVTTRRGETTTLVSSEIPSASAHSASASQATLAPSHPGKPAQTVRPSATALPSQPEVARDRPEKPQPAPPPLYRLRRFPFAPPKDATPASVPARLSPVAPRPARGKSAQPTSPPFVQEGERAPPYAWTPLSAAPARPATGPLAPQHHPAPATSFPLPPFARLDPAPTPNPFADAELEDRIGDLLEVAALAGGVDPS